VSPGSTKKTGFVSPGNTVLCHLVARINTKVRHIIIGGGFLAIGFQEGQEVCQNFKDTLILCYAHKKTHSARALQHGWPQPLCAYFFR
jgi:hypothetical protein